jgi:hypothetical protein
VGSDPVTGVEWHEAVGERDGYRCAARTHHKQCDRGYAECHHLIYLSFLCKPARYLVENGVALSQYCHILAHSSHNGNIAKGRLDAAVKRVNAVTVEFNAYRGKGVAQRKQFARKDGTL